jgi:hypothetical protein
MIRIPKIIWQTHEWDYSDLPINFKRATMTWKNLNPTWEYRYVNATERAKQVRAYSEEAYLFYSFTDKVTQADLWRYIVLLENGGVYADMDSVCSAPLDYILEAAPPKTRFIATGLDENSRVNNANFGCVKKSEVLKRLLNKILGQYRSINIASILNIMSSGKLFQEAINYYLYTGPDIYSSVVLDSDYVWLDYTGAVHTRDVKDDPEYLPIQIVNYYGEHKSYLKLVEEHGWSLT